MTNSKESAYSEVILEHYRKEAELHGRDASSTMRDEITRGREVAGITRTVEWLRENGHRLDNLLDVGCGNGYLLEALREKNAGLGLTGLEYTPQLVEVAQQRDVSACQIVAGDVRKLPFEDNSFDVVVTERCIINIMDQEDQAVSLREVARVLRSGGHYICIEAFTDGFEGLNEARAELGLEANAVPYHNLWLDKDWFLKVIAEDFDVVDVKGHGDPSVPSPNFLSSHYFVSRVLYPAITKTDIVYNSHLVKFFSFLPPMGNYSAIQFWVLRKR